MQKVFASPKRIWKFVLKRKWYMVCIVIVLGILGFIFFPRSQKPLPTQAVKYEDLVQSLSVTGTAQARNQINLTFPIGGTVSWVGVKKGSSVSKFETIATLDQRTAQKNLQAALLTYADQRNSFDQTQDNNQNNPLTTALQRVLATNQNDLNKAVVSVELQDLAKQQSILSTPIAGIVTRADTEVAGITAVAGTTTFTVTDPLSVVFDADVDQADIGKVEAGQIVKIVFDAYSSDTLEEPVTSIDFVSHTTSNGSAAYTIETALPDNSMYKYRVGMNANAEIILSETPHILTVPIASIVDDTYVYVLQNGKVYKRKITLGIQNDTDAQVLHGLKEGEIVVVDPSQVSSQMISK